MKTIRLFLFAIILLQCSIVFAQTKNPAEIKRIEQYSKAIDAFVGKNKNPHSIYADTSDYNEDSKAKWQKFATEKELEKFRDQTETYTIAYNWLKNGKIVQTNFTLFSPSGDWAEYVFHYFRADGSLAKVASEMRSFYSNSIMVQDFYFDPKGNLMKKSVKYFHLRTQKPIKPTKEFLESIGDLGNDVEYYKSTDKLPFADLLKK